MKNGLFICWEFVSTYTFVFRESASFSFHFIEKIEKCLHPPRRPITGHRDELSVHIPTGWLHYSIQDIHICYLWSFANSNKKLQPIHVIWNKNFTYSTSMFWFCSITSTFFFTFLHYRQNREGFQFSYFQRCMVDNWWVVKAQFTYLQSWLISEEFCKWFSS
jgi:hypothetical protein